MLDTNVLFSIVVAEIMVVLGFMLLFRKNRQERRRVLSYVGMALAIFNFVLLMASKFMD